MRSSAHRVVLATCLAPAAAAAGAAGPATAHEQLAHPVAAACTAAALTTVLFVVAWCCIGSGGVPVGAYAPQPPPPPADPHAAHTSTTATPDAAAPHFPGLRNPGVLCFFNSVVQSLASIAPLAAYLDQAAEMARRWDTPAPVTHALRALIIELNTPLARRRALAPRALLGALGNVSQSSGLRTLIAAHQQQDAHELAVLLLGALDAELAAIQARRADALRTIGLESLTGPSALRGGRPSTALGGADRAAPMCRGTIAQRTACAQCGYSEAVRHFSFDDLSLTVPLALECTLDTCLAEWAQLEQIEWVCHRCSLAATQQRIHAQAAAAAAAAGAAPRRRREREHLLHMERRVADVLARGLHEDELDASGLLHDVPLERALSPLSSKQVLIARPPPVLVIHLNRSLYAYGAAKNNARVRFPEWLDIAPYTTGALRMDARRPMSAPPAPSAQTLFRLVAVVTHYGSHSAGHYVSFRRRAGDVWTRVSDENVDACSLAHALAQNPFLLFYERADQAPALCGASDAARVALGAQPHSAAARIAHRWHVTS